jgi:putative metallopeptidase DUF4344
MAWWRAAADRRLCGLRLFGALLLWLTSDTGPVVAQEFPTEIQTYERRLADAVDGLVDAPLFKRFAVKERKEAVEFVLGNTLFVLLHELGHAMINELDLPVLGREEDAADNFAAVTLLKLRTSFSHRVLVEAAKGWFLSDRRAQVTGDQVVYYDAHGLDRQRAYNIVCLMVGFDPEKFADLAAETKLPKDRQETCLGDYSNASRSWDSVLKPHRRAPDQPETKIDVSYGDATGELSHYAQTFRSIRVLESIAEATAYVTAWPRPFVLEMKSCGAAEAHWSNVNHRLSFCYEMAADLASLYRDYVDAEDRPTSPPACRCGHGTAPLSPDSSRLGRPRPSHSRLHVRR